MSQVNPLVFGAVVLALVAVIMFVPKLISKPKGETADELYVGSLRSVYDAPDTARPATARVGSVTPPINTVQVPVGAPRAASPVAAPPVPNSDPQSVAPPQGDGLAPLKLPVV